LRGWRQTVPNEANPRHILRLDPLIRSGLQARPCRRRVSLNELTKFVLVEYVKQSAEVKEGTPVRAPAPSNRTGKGLSSKLTGTKWLALAGELAISQRHNSDSISARRQHQIVTMSGLG
jgi:hypothetical protein